MMKQDETALPHDFVVLATVRMPDTGEVHSVIYDFGNACADVVPMALAEDTRWYRGIPVQWQKESSFELIQRAPSGEGGAIDVGEVRGVITAEVDGGITLHAGGRPLGRLINIGQVDHFLSMDQETMNRRLGHVGTGRGARILHDGSGLIYRIIKDKPALRLGRA
jgi:hypothetical protein